MFGSSNSLGEYVASARLDYPGVRNVRVIDFADRLPQLHEVKNVWEYVANAQHDYAAVI